MGLFSCFTSSTVTESVSKVPDFANNPRAWDFPIKIYGAGPATPGIMTVTRQLLAQQQLANMVEAAKK